MVSRTPLIAGNWKMNKDCSESISYAKNITNVLKKENKIEVLIAPPYTSLFPISSILENSNIKLSTQNIFFETSGSFTGEISAEMVKGLGCKYAILGHSERRNMFNENDEIINKKVKSAIKHGLIPILCIGESKTEKINARTLSVINKQIKKGLSTVEEKQLNEFVIAYEPIWAIGTGDSSSPNYAQKIHHHIRLLIEVLYSKLTSEKIRIIYGGSVSEKNVEKYMAMPDIDGVLIGKASLNYVRFAELVSNAIKAQKYKEQSC